MDQLRQYLPINEVKYDKLCEEGGLDGFKLMAAMHGNVVLSKDNMIIKHLNNFRRDEIIEELNQLQNGYNVQNVIPMVVKNQKNNV